jgi:two-component system LytT family response regulator
MPSGSLEVAWGRMVATSSVPITVLVVDDEHLARERLRVLLGGEPQVQLIGQCENGVEAVAAITSEKPELVFLDVQMPDVDGLGVIAALGEEETPEIIFVTAHNAYMERAFELHAVDYLRKPYTNARFASALAHARKRIHARRVERGAIADATESVPRPTSRYRPILAALHEVNDDLHLALQDPRTGIWDIVRPSDIELISADGSSRVLVHAGEGSYTWRRTLTAVAETLDPRVFMRVHRSHIVNANHIRQVKSLPKGEFMIHLRSGRKMDTGRTYRGVIEQFLGDPARAS